MVIFIVLCLQYFEILEGIVIHAMMGDIVELVNLIENLLEIRVVLFLLMNVEDDSAAYQRSQDIQFVLQSVYPR